MFFDKSSKVNLSDFRDIRKGIKGFFFSRLNRELLVLCFFIIVSASFWLLKTLDGEFECDLEVPVTLVDVPDGVVVTESLKPEVSVTVRNVGTMLLSYMFRSDKKPVVIRFSEYSHSDGRMVVGFQEIQKNIQAALGNSAKIIAMKPDSLEVFYSSGKSKIVPVVVANSYKVASQCYLSKVEVSPRQVRVYAPSSVLDTLTAVYAAPHFDVELNEPVMAAVPVSKIRGAKVFPSKVNVKLSVDRFVEKSVEVGVTGINFPPDMVLRTFPAKVNIVFQVGLRNYQSIDAGDFVISVSYEELLRVGDGKCPLRLKSLPAGVRHARIEPSSVDYLIEEIKSYD